MISSSRFNASCSFHPIFFIFIGFILVNVRFHFSSVIFILHRLIPHPFIMPYFVVTAKEKNQGTKSRRNIALEAAGMESAKAAFIDKCSDLNVEPNFITLRRVTRIEYEAVIATLMERNL